MKCVIFDIDGTLANAQHRIHHIKKRPKDWDSFFGSMIDDKPFWHIREVLLSLRNGNTMPIIFASGRPEKYRDVTVQWLEKWDLHDSILSGHIRLYMRPDGDRRDDDIVKREILGKMWQDGWEPLMAFDDRDRVVKMWRDNGVPCLQVAEGDF